MAESVFIGQREALESEFSKKAREFRQGSCFCDSESVFCRRGQRRLGGKVAGREGAPLSHALNPKPS